MASTNVQELIEFNIMSLNKTQLQNKCIEIQQALKVVTEEKSNSSEFTSLLIRLEMLEKNQLQTAVDIDSLKKENHQLKKKVKYIEEDLDDADDRFIDLEKSVTQCDQYSRRENFEIAGIPDNLPQEDLEKKVIEIVNVITEKEDNITPKDIHACHRLKKEKGENNSRVIVRMVNRKDTYEVLTNKKKLKDKAKDLGFNELFISENLCQNNKNIMDDARNLKKKKLIKSCWSINGTVHIKIKEEDRRGIKIIHTSDFEDHFTREQLNWD